jgi:hypothetical protein
VRHIPSADDILLALHVSVMDVFICNQHNGYVMLKWDAVYGYPISSESTPYHIPTLMYAVSGICDSHNKNAENDVSSWACGVHDFSFGVLHPAVDYFLTKLRCFSYAG